MHASCHESTDRTLIVQLYMGKTPKYNNCCHYRFLVVRRKTVFSDAQDRELILRLVRLARYVIDRSRL